MRPILAFLLFAGLAVSCLAGQPYIDGPTDVPVGEAARWEVRGLPPLDMDMPLGEQLNWLTQAAPYSLPQSTSSPLKSRVYFSPVEARKGVVQQVEALLDGADNEAAIVEKLRQAVADVAAGQEPGATIEWVWELETQFNEGGRATIAVDWNLDKPLLALHEVLVGDGPEPVPPPPPPPPTEDLWCIIVEETAERTPEQKIVLLSLEVRKLFTDEVFRLVDKDTAPGKDEPYLQDYIDRAIQGKLPTLFLVGDDGKVRYEGPLPATVAAMVKLVEDTKKGVQDEQ